MNSLHEKVYQLIEECRLEFPDFYFLYRQNDRKIKDKETTKFQEGTWFQGNENYAFVGLYDRSGGANMTRSMGLVFTLDQDLLRCYIELSHKGEEDLKVVEFYHEMMEMIGGFTEVKKEGYHRLFSTTNVRDAIKQFLQNEKPKIDQLIRDRQLDHLFITKNKFEKIRTRILAHRAKSNSKSHLLNPYIEQYKLLIQNKLPNQEYLELYKWETVQHFQENWGDSISEDTILENLKGAFDRPNNNLWSGSHYLPFKMLLVFAEEQAIVIAEMFKNLYDEKVDLYERIEYFQRKAEIVNDNLHPNQKLQHHQSKRAVMLYLALKYPDKYYLYKNGMYNDFCNITGFEPPPGKGKKYKYEILKTYTAMCDSVRSILIADQELMQIHQRLLPEHITFNDKCYLLTQDFIYCVTTYLKPSKVQQIKTTNDMENIHPLNQILFGPPGTGKTYSTIDRVVELLAPELYRADDHQLNKVAYQQLKEEGRVAFTTFHQSMSYEDFVEGIKPRTGENNEVYYEIEEGIFKEMVSRAKSTTKLLSQTGVAKPYIESSILEKANFYKISLGDSTKPEDEVIYDYCIENNCIAIGYGNDIDFTEATNQEEIEKHFTENGITLKERNDYGVIAIKCLKIWMKAGDIVFVSNGNRKCKAIGLIDGDYFYNLETSINYTQFRKVKWLYTDLDLDVKSIYKSWFSQQTIYGMYKNKVKLDFFSEQKNKTNNNKFALIIDEINRGNVSEIFGELITLLEADKREGAKEELSVVLPYSKTEFSVPSNLFIIGTMNTADRSVEALDTALRRRFSFVEVAPDPNLLADIEVEAIDFPKLLRTINQRIEKLLNKDYMIGHAYFMALKDAEHPKAVLKRIFADKIVPLLQEYFYGSFGKIQLVLGRIFVKKEEQQEVQFAEADFIGVDYQDRAIYHIADINATDFDIVKAVKSIYA